MPEMPHSVSPGCTVCESGALGARSSSGTPAWATRWAVSRHSGVTGRLLVCAKAWQLALASASSAKPGTAASRRTFDKGRRMRWLMALMVSGQMLRRGGAKMKAGLR